VGLHHVDHYSIGTSDLEASRKFYCGILGLYEGDRPALPFPGAWLYCENNIPTVHIIDLGGADAPARAATGAFNHISFACTGAEALRARLQDNGIDFRVVVLPNGKTQFFMRDPDNVSVELIFEPHETREEDRAAMAVKSGEDYLL
jgi:catechol 2,3-dioxygenase-like lactoylglutathione lyase family enzyme